MVFILHFRIGRAWHGWLRALSGASVLFSALVLSSALVPDANAQSDATGSDSTGPGGPGSNPPAVTRSIGPAVTITPRRVVFEGRSRTAEVTLFNRGDSTAVYRLSFVQARMKDNGDLETITVLGLEDRPADPFIRYAPRQVVLEPKAPQTVRLFLRKPSDLEPGEYRSHLLFRSIPPEAGTDIEDAIKARDDGAVIPRLVPIPALVIPVIFRHGELAVRLSLANAAFDPGNLPAPTSADPQRPEGRPVPGATPPRLSFDLHREGERSVYFDASVQFSSDLDGSVTPVGTVRGLAVYSPNQKIRLRLPLRPPPGLTLSQGTLHIALTTQDGMDGEQIAGGTVLAKGEIALP